MTDKNNFGKTFGPVGSSAGVLIMVVGICAAYFYSLSALILVLLGALVGLTSSSTRIDYSQKRVKNALNLFGIIPIGKWLIVEADMLIGIKKSNLTWRTYSRSNQTLDIKDDAYIITLFDATNHPVLPLKKSKSIELAKHESVQLAEKLGIMS